MARFAPLFALLVLVAAAGTAVAGSERPGRNASPGTEAEAGACEAEADADAEQAARAPNASVTVSGLPQLRIVQAALAAAGMTAPSSSADESSGCVVTQHGTIQCGTSSGTAKTG